MIQQLPRRERERQMRRQEIIDAARIVFARKGFSDAKLEDVAERAEFGKGTLYNYFTNKEALFASVIEDSFFKVKTIAEETFNSDLPFEAKIDGFISGELGYFFHNPEAMHLMMRESHYLRGNNPLMQLLPQLLRILSDTIAAEQKSGTITVKAEPVELASLLMNLMFGQFSVRVYKKIFAGLTREMIDDECNISQLFGDLNPEEIEAEIASATKLIRTVFLHGITH